VIYDSFVEYAQEDNGDHETGFTGEANAKERQREKHLGPQTPAEHPDR